MIFFSILEISVFIKEAVRSQELECVMDVAGMLSEGMGKDRYFLHCHTFHIFFY